MSWISIFAGERDPNKRRVKPVEQPLFDLDLESSDDSDFNPEEHKDGSDDSIDSNDEGGGGGSGSDNGNDDDDEDDDSEDDSDVDETENSKSPVTAEELQQRLNSADGLNSEIVKKVKKKIQKRCWGCLGDTNEDFDELVECDMCGVTVHEKCYGMSDSDSLASVDSSNPDLPWFCDVCRSGVKDPTCELCPNSGGIFKETDVGRWVHLVCALYIPGLFPNDGEKLSLFKMSYAKYGAKMCTLCEDERLARTGVCIECDAGMCRTYFHASCAQKMGLLQEAHPEEPETVDKFYAHCKLHSDKAQTKRRRQNFILLQERLKERSQEQELKDKNDLERIQRKYRKACSHYLDHHLAIAQSFVSPIQKLPRALITSATACRLLWRKAELAGLNTEAMEMQDTQIASLKDINRKWHIPPSFSVEFISYFLDRVGRITKMKKQVKDYVETNARLLDEQKAVGERYEQLLNTQAEEDAKNKSLREQVERLHGLIRALCPNKVLPSIESICNPQSATINAPTGVPTAAALKSFSYPVPVPSGSGFLVNSKGVVHAGAVEITASGSNTPVLGPCGKCRQSNDPHLLAHCDNCKQYYHLGCLNPPLTRMPKKTKLFGWQCSECDKESSGSDVPCLDPEAPRKLRRKSEKTSKASSVKSDGEAVLSDTAIISNNVSLDAGNDADVEAIVVTNSEGKSKASKKKRKEKHRYSPEPDGIFVERKRKRKKKSFDHENWQVEESPSHPQPHVPKIKIKTITPPGEGQSVQTYVASAMTSDEDVSRPIVVSGTIPVQVPTVYPVTSPATSTTLDPSQSPTIGRPQRQSGGKKVKVEDILTQCDQCSSSGSKENLVRCDECQKCYHFHCLDPPVKKSPKIRGYSWHCADCDPSDSSSSSRK